MKLFILLCLITASFSTQAQGLFKPVPKPGSAHNGKFGLAVADSVMNSIRPLVGVTAIVSDGSQLGGGIGIGLQHLKYNQPSQAWVMQYSVSAIAFLGSSGGSATITGGIVVGFLNLFQIGGGYDFTNKRAVLLTGIGINFN